MTIKIDLSYPYPFIVIKLLVILWNNVPIKCFCSEHLNWICLRSPSLKWYEHSRFRNLLTMILILAFLKIWAIKYPYVPNVTESVSPLYFHQPSLQYKYTGKNNGLD